jgi:hypothetical protein
VATPLARITSDLEQARAAIDLWQHAVLTSQLANHRELALLNSALPEAVTGSVAGWLDLLRDCAGEDERTLRAITREVMQIGEWAEEARLALRLIAAIA